PFHVTRFFRPTFLEVFNLTNGQLGDVFAVYGIFATLAYFPGGVLADYFSARKLMTASLLATALGGVLIAQIPSFWGLSLIFAFWGLTTILMFWAALIKATREWGGEQKSGSAFGILDGGRGLVAAIVATAAVWIFTLLLPEKLDSLTTEQRASALQGVIYFYALLTAIAGVFVWLILPQTNQKTAPMPILQGIRQAASMPLIWLQGLVIICAYAAFKALDNYGLYIQAITGINELETARFSAISYYMRPIAAVTAGFIVDRFSASRVISIAFATLVISYFILGFASASTYGLNLLYANILVTLAAVFGIRGVYFALIEETKIDKKMTGTAVGLISAIGFTSEIFFAPISGRLLDASPGITGHQQVFIMLAIISVIGIIATLVIAHYNKPNSIKPA
ncbi:hypothetical protein MNBD_GAMMA12-90, partial [hydrothermal vent metagenome]